MSSRKWFKALCSNIVGPRGAAALIGALLLLPAAWAQLSTTTSGNPVAPAAQTADASVSTGPVRAEIRQFLVMKDGGGKEAFKEGASTVKPGDVIEYRVIYANRGSQAVSDIKANLPIPEGTEYVARSARPQGSILTASTGDGQFAAEPLMHTPPGKTKLEPVPYEAYRGLRWDLGLLPAGAISEVKARVRVQTFNPGLRLPSSAEPAPAAR